MRKVYVRLGQPHIDALVRLAEAERREPCDQAALLLEPVIERLMEQQQTPKREVLVT